MKHHYPGCELGDRCNCDDIDEADECEEANIYHTPQHVIDYMEQSNTLSDTPETDNIAAMRRTHQEWQAHAERLEHERDEPIHAASDIKNAKGRYHTQQATERLFALLERIYS